jgi:Ca2+/Na+ antiporter
MAKKYSVNVDDNDEVVSVEVDGVVYKHPDDIPDPEDRARILSLMDQSSDDDFDPEFEKAFENFDEEFREMESQSAKFPVLIVAIFLIVAGITLTISTISAINSSRTVAREQKAPGEVVDLTVRKSQGGYDSEGTYQAPQDYYYPIVAFSLPDGTIKTVQLSEGSWPPAYEKGEQVTILYDPAKPINARIQSTTSDILLWLLPGITGVIGVGFLIAAGTVAWFFRSSPPKNQVSSR